MYLNLCVYESRKWTIPQLLQRRLSPVSPSLHLLLFLLFFLYPKMGGGGCQDWELIIHLLLSLPDIKAVFLPWLRHPILKGSQGEWRRKMEMWWWVVVVCGRELSPAFSYLQSVQVSMFYLTGTILFSHHPQEIIFILKALLA